MDFSPTINAHRCPCLYKNDNPLLTEVRETRSWDRIRPGIHEKDRIKLPLTVEILTTTWSSIIMESLCSQLTVKRRQPLDDTAEIVGY